MILKTILQSIFTCMFAFPLCLSVHHVPVVLLPARRGRVDPRGTGVTQGCEGPEGTGNQTQVLWTKASTLIYWGTCPALLSSYLKCWNNFAVLPGCLVSMVHHLNIVGYMFYNILVGITCLFMLRSVPHVWQVFYN